MASALRTICFVLLVFVLQSVGQVRAADFPFHARPNRDHVRVRADSTTNSPILGELNSDSVISVISERWNWYQVRLSPEIPGYIHSEYLRSSARGETEITRDHVNVRANPTLSAPILGQLDKHVRVEVVRREGKWARVRSLPTLTGYVHSRLLTRVPSPTEEQISEELDQTESLP